MLGPSPDFSRFLVPCNCRTLCSRGLQPAFRFRNTVSTGRRRTRAKARDYIADPEYRPKSVRNPGSLVSKGIRPILKQLRTLAGFLFFVAAGSASRQKIESRRKLKMSPNFQEFRGRFKTTREDRKLWPKIQIVSRTLGAPPEIRKCSGTIEEFRGKLDLPQENSNLRPERERLWGKFEFPRENLDFSPDRRSRLRKKKKFRGKSQCSAENPDRQRRMKSSAGKSKLQ